MADRPKLSATWARLREDTALSGADWSRAAQAVTDEWLRQLFAEATGLGPDGGTTAEPTPPAAPPPERSSWLRRGRQSGTANVNPSPGARGVALLAVGSLGRGDLAPGSDLDLLLVHAGRSDVVELADRLWYPIWDDPMPLDHSVRTLSQMEQAAAADLKVAQGLLDARPIAGDMQLAADTLATVKQLWQKHVSRWLPDVLAARRSAYETHGDVAFLLEPDLQEGHGGLRDLQLLALMAAVTPVVRQVVADEHLKPAAERLHAIRVELQRPSGRRSERLALEDQDRVARALKVASREELARQLATAGRTIAWLTEDAERRARSWLAGPKGRTGSADRALEAGLVLRDNEVAVPLSTTSAAEPSLPLRSAAASAELGVPLSRSTMAYLAEARPALAEPWPPEVTRALLRLLSTGRAGVHAIETLDQLGVWERYLPEWAHVRNRPQFNPYHRFTVDRHLLETVANAAAAQREVRRPDLLVLAALLHDIGKGAPEDHSEAGARVAGRVARRLGLSNEDSRILVKVVRHHLLLPDTATRRDLEDPATCDLVARAVGDETTLELLRALVEADGAATGPAAWSPWRAGLVQELVARTEAVLAGRPAPRGTKFPSAEHRRLMKAGGLHVFSGKGDLVVVAPDRPGLLSDVTGVLALYGVGVLQARVHSEDGTALEVFTLDLSTNAHPRWERVATDIERAAKRQFDVGAALAHQAPSRELRRAVALGVPDALVLVDNSASATATVVDVRALDAPGVLHRITAAIASQGLDIISARVATLGTAVVDSFYVQANGAKLSDDSRAEALRSAILDRLAGIGQPG
ncbi:MAG: [protein-PII] uridylyltransferase [Acidimicrobiales bacterium]